jgi:uncharacterized paraquat-inducible protein A
MPWCEDCSRFWNPNSVPAKGTCPSCGAELQGPLRDDEYLKAPWHFKVLVACAAVYLVWRALQLAGVMA